MIPRLAAAARCLCAVAALTGLSHAIEETGTKPPFAIRFTLDKPGVVTLVIDDAAGNRVRNLIAETPFEAGEHVVEWDGRNDRQPKQVHEQPVFEFGGAFHGTGPLHRARPRA